MCIYATTLNTFFDYGVGALILFVSIGVSVITFVMVVICEALTFYGLGYRSFWRSFVISLLINLISTALGYGIAFIQYQIPYHYIPFLLTNARTTVLEVLILFGAFWGVSIVSEGEYSCYWIKPNHPGLFGV